MAKAKVKKKNSTRTAQNVETCIVEVSLQHPELGARRLVPLLKKKRISVSAATIQNILRRHGLQNRKNRMAKLEAQSKKTRKANSPPKKPSNKITDDVAGRICKISLQNPDRGAKSLVPLLKEKGISVSSSAVYRILKHHELHTRAKRYARAAEISSKPVIIPKTFSEKISPEVEDRIVEISLQHPECGARRLLPLLQQEEIFVSVSAVYRILKRHEIENRQKRLLKLEALQVPEAPAEPEIEGPEPITEAPQKGPTTAEDEAPVPIPEPAVAEAAEAVEPAAPAEPERPPVRKAHLNLFKIRSHPAFYPLYLLLFALIGYMGFQAFQSMQQARSETGFVSAAGPAVAGVSAKAESAVFERPLDGYRRIWERNLFNIARAGDSGSEKKIAIEKVAPAKKDLGLKLVGTVMADNSELRRAFIFNSRTRGQRAYREGDTIGQVKIKKILRNNVVITTTQGNELLTFEIQESGKSSPSALAQRVGSQSSSVKQSTISRRPGARTRSISLERDEVAASLADIDQLLAGLNLSPYERFEKPAGFRISNISSDSILSKMGLSSRDVIVAINDQKITSPDQAAEFFSTIANGGEVTIRARRRLRTRRINLSIE